MAAGLTALSDDDLLARKAKLEKQRVKLQAQIKEEVLDPVGPITREQFRRATEKQIVAKLRNNQPLSKDQLRHLGTLTDARIEELEAEAVATAKAAKKKNPAWHPVRETRKYDILAEARKARSVSREGS
jgi:hypothetical protein